MAESTNTDDSPAIAITLGDPRGIGPFVALRAIERLAGESEGRCLPRLVLVGPDNLDVLRELPPGVEILPVDPWDGSDGSAGRVAAQAIEVGARLGLEGAVDALVTAPIHKPSLHAAGWKVPGHTELLQELTGAPRVGMLMSAEETSLGGALRVLLATTHLPLREVPHALSTELLIDQTILLHEALEARWRIAAPRIALCALNPHASDDGLFGDEEARVLTPAVRHLKALSMDISGPIPADTVFTRTLRGEFDAVVAPYHDVGMAAFKTASFGAGVNITLGLPFIRTSPDHGTAFDLASKPDRADPSSMLEAVRLAHRLSMCRFDVESADV